MSENWFSKYFINSIREFILFKVYCDSLRRAFMCDLKTNYR